MDTEFDFESVKRMESARKIKPTAVLSEDLSPGIDGSTYTKICSILAKTK